jgi:26S proteasome regulatory subunit N9
MLVMKAMSLELVKGSIDEVDKTVHIEWIMPRYLNKEHMQILADRLGEWK